MPDLFQTLRSTDLDFLQRVAHAWKLDLAAKGFPTALEEIQALLKDRDTFDEMLAELSPRAKDAWDYLLKQNGRESWSIFTRQFGELRPFGAAKRIRETPDLHPTSASEELWYRSLIGRAFLDFPPEPREFAYIPDEFWGFVRPANQEQELLQLRPATANENQVHFAASDNILDDITEYLAALRMGRPTAGIFPESEVDRQPFVQKLLLKMGILTDEKTLDAARVKDYLALNRANALSELFTTWVNSKISNDLRMLPGLLFEGNWSNDPLAPRQLILNNIKQANPLTWWSISGFIDQVKAKEPDFERPAGDYDSWFIRDAKSNEHLHGVEHWDEVEGALLYYLLTGPLHWLGIVDLAAKEKIGTFGAFKLSALGVDLANDRLPEKCKAEEGSLAISTDGAVHVPGDVPRATRYQIARFCVPLKQSASERQYRITPASLKLAGKQGLKVSHLLLLFQQAKVKNIPPNLVQQLERWDKYGSEVVVEKAILLHLARPELLPLLQKDVRASQCISAVLNSQTIVIKPGKVEALRQSLAEMSLLADINIDSDV